MKRYGKYEDIVLYYPANEWDVNDWYCALSWSNFGPEEKLVWTHFLNGWHSTRSSIELRGRDRFQAHHNLIPAKRSTN